MAKKATSDFKQTEIGEIPADWDVRLLGDVTNNFDKKRRPLNSMERKAIRGKYPYCGANGIVDYVNSYQLDGEYVLLAEDGGYWGPGENSSYIMTGKFWVNNHAHILQSKEGVADTCFLSNVLNFLNLNAFIGGDARGKLNQATMRKIKIPMPSKPEQVKIAGTLSRIQKIVENQEKLIADLRELKAATALKLFRDGLRGEPRKETEIGEIPRSWKLTRLKELVSHKITDGTHVTPKYEVSGIPFVTATNLTTDKIHFENCKYISKKEHALLSRRCLPQRGDILLSKVGTVGLVAEVETDCEFSIFVQLALLKVKKEVISSTFLKHALQSESLQRLINTRASRSTMLYIGVSKIGELEIPVPGQEEQKEIVMILNCIDSKIDSANKKCENLRFLFSSTLNQLMTGKVRVNFL